LAAPDQMQVPTVLPLQRGDGLDDVASQLRRVLPRQGLGERH
jgi:hypothetical protein